MTYVTQGSRVKVIWSGGIRAAMGARGTHRTLTVGVLWPTHTVSTNSKTPLLSAVHVVGGSAGLVRGRSSVAVMLHGRMRAAAHVHATTPTLECAVTRSSMQ